MCRSWIFNQKWVSAQLISKRQLVKVLHEIIYRVNQGLPCKYNSVVWHCGKIRYGCYVGNIADNTFGAICRERLKYAAQLRNRSQVFAALGLN